MPRQNVPLLSIGNRGLISPKSLARVDLDRTRLSAETFHNFIGKTVGALTIRPGTKYFGSSLNDTGAEFIEFVASTNDVALLELTNGKMRIWLGDDAHSIALLSRPAVDTTLTLADTGWSNTSTGGAVSPGSNSDVIPTMTGASTGGVTITASSENYGREAWRVSDNNNSTAWQDTGRFDGVGSLPSWINVDFDTGANTSDRKSIETYSMRASSSAAEIDNIPRDWKLITGNYDTGTYATDTGKWTLEDERSGQIDWAVGEKRYFTLPGADTGTIEARRHWRLYVTAVDTGAGDASGEITLPELEMFTSSVVQHVGLAGGKRYLNATSIGALARVEKRVMVSDTGTEHSLNITVERGPVTLRVGSTQRDDDYIRETSLGTGYHNLSFTPQGNFWVTLQTDADVNRIISALSIGDSGTVEVTAPWSHSDLDNIRYDQSADVVYVACDGIRPRKIERRGTGRSWSIIEYAPNNGPFKTAASSSAKMSISARSGNATITSSIPFFTSDHVGALFRIFHEGQGGTWNLGAADAKTNLIQVSGISDTGTTPSDDTGVSERNITFAVSGTYTGRVIIEQSIDGENIGFKPLNSGFSFGGSVSDTGTFFRKIVDRDDNVKKWFRARMSEYTSGAAVVKVKYSYGGITGVARITGYNSNTSVDAEVLSRFSDTGASENWQESYWSAENGYPTAVALHGGRLGYAMGGSLFLSVSDDYENFDDTTKGDSAPIIRTLGSGPVDNIRYLISQLRMIIGTAGAEMTLRSSSFDEPVTPSNSSTGTFSTQGSSNLRALKLDTRTLFVQRSNQRVFMVGPAQNGIGDYESFELTKLVPDLLAAGTVSVAVQRQPDTRLHCVLADGTVGILMYEPQEEVISWFTWETDGYVERAAVLPGVSEDAVFYHVRRTINGVTKRYLEKWALESECVGDTGLSWIMDCAKSYTDTGRSSILTGFSHLAGKSVIVWADDTGQATAGKDLSPDVAGVQTTYAVDTGAGTITLNEAVHHAVAGLPYTADWTSSKLAYAAAAGTALAQVKRAAQVAFVLYKTHNRGLQYGSDTGHLDNLPKVIDGKVVDPDTIFETFDQVAVSMDSTHNPDARLHLRAKAPRPCTVLAAVPSVETNERV